MKTGMCVLFDRLRKQKENKYSYLQRTMPGGIMIIEIGFTGVHFGVHVYALECSRIPVGRSVNRHVSTLLFTVRECKISSKCILPGSEKKGFIKKYAAYNC